MSDKVTVKILRNCSAAGESQTAGAIVAFTAKIAGELIACRAAEPFTKPAKAKVETATAPIEAKESATVATHKHRKTRR